MCELVFRIPESLFRKFSVRGTFDQKLSYYARNLAKPVQDWIDAHEYVWNALQTKRIHLNTESGASTNDEAGTVALVKLFKDAGWSVTVLILDWWSADSPKRMSGAQNFAYRMYNLRPQMQDRADVRLRADTTRLRLVRAGLSARQLILTVAYYAATAVHDLSKENISMYAASFIEYRYLKAFGVSYVYDFVAYEPMLGIPSGDGSYIRKGDLDAHDTLYGKSHVPGLTTESLWWSPVAPKEGDLVVLGVTSVTRET